MSTNIETVKLDPQIAVYVDGRRRLVTRDRDKADAYAAEKMAKRHNVWVGKHKPLEAIMNAPTF